MRNPSQPESISDAATSWGRYPSNYPIYSYSLTVNASKTCLFCKTSITKILLVRLIHKTITKGWQSKFNNLTMIGHVFVDLILIMFYEKVSPHAISIRDPGVFDLQHFL